MAHRSPLHRITAGPSTAMRVIVGRNGSRVPPPGTTAFGLHLIEQASARAPRGLADNDSRRLR